MSAGRILAAAAAVLIAAGIPRAAEALRIGPDAIDPAQTFVDANAAYEEGAYDRAVALYEALLDRDAGNGRVHYNLGNAYLRNGELGRAIAEYRRCQSLRPRDSDVRANLAFARKSAKDAIAPPAPPAALRTLMFWHYALSRRELYAGLAVANLLLWSVLAVRLFRRGSEFLRWSAIVLFLIVAALGGSLITRIVSPRIVAVVIPQEVDIRSGTGPDTVVRFKLHAGTEVRAVEERDDWVRIALPDGQQGWIENEHVEIVRI